MYSDVTHTHRLLMTRAQRNLTRRNLVRIRVARVAQIRAVMLARKAVAAAGANGITRPSQAALLLRTLAETSVEGRMTIRTGAVHTVVKGMPIMTSGEWLCCRWGSFVVFIHRMTHILCLFSI